MNEYIAAFFSHFGAISYCKELKAQGIDAKPMPVPRAVSSSCGTCVSYAYSIPIEVDDCDLEAIYVKAGGAFECVVKISDE